MQHYQITFFLSIEHKNPRILKNGHRSYVDIMTERNILRQFIFVVHFVHPVGGKGMKGRNRYFSQLRVSLYQRT